MRHSLLLLCFALGPAGLAAEVERAIPLACRQLVLVAAPEWHSTRGTVRRFERHARSPWREIGEAHAVLLGERGLAWGLGLHEAPPGSDRRKREGDRCAPAGIFRLTSAFGRQPRSWTVGDLFPYRQLSGGTEAVDDPASRFYNRIVERPQVRTVDWKSSERMAEIADYELGAVVAHNPQNTPGAGSCIFIHQWRGERVGTAGCTALRAPHLVELVRWLEARKSPVLVQLPRSEMKNFP